jgi:hypothetical protein
MPLLDHDAPILAEAAERGLESEVACRLAHRMACEGGEPELRVFVAMCLLIGVCPACTSERFEVDRAGMH